MGGNSPPPPPAFCALHRGGVPGLLLPDNPEPTGGVRWGRGCEVTARDCQQQEGAGEELVAEAGKVTTLLGCEAIKTPSSAEK